MSRPGETPAKVREDLEKSLTELNNLSLSICNSEVSPFPLPDDDDDDPSQSHISSLGSNRFESNQALHLVL